MSIDEWMNKQTMVHLYNAILFSLKKEGNSDTGYNTDEFGGHYAKWNKPDTEGQILISLIWPHLNDLTYMRSLEESDSRDRKEHGGCQGWGRGNAEFVFNGDRVSVWGDEGVLRMDDGDVAQQCGRTYCYWTVHFQMVTKVNFMLCTRLSLVAQTEW